MRALFLCPNVPYPPLNGGEHRNLGLIRSLARFASVHVLAIGDPRGERVGQAREALAAWDATLDVYQPTGPGAAEDDEAGTERLPDAACHFRSPELRAALAGAFETSRPDVAHVEEVVMAQYVDLLPCPRVIDRQKVDWAYHEAMAEVVGSGSLAHRREAARFRWWEQRLVGVFDRILVPGEGDRRLLLPFHGSGSVTIVPIGIGDELQAPAGPARHVEHVLLYGALDYGPNVEAQKWFFQEVWPGLKAAVPGLRVRIVGSGRPPLAAPPPPSDAAVEVRGFVPDIRTVLEGPGVLVVAVQVGGGARTKVLEALACGMPVVSTALGVENLGLVPGREYLPAETAAEVTGAVVRLVRDPGLAASLGRAGAARAESFRWSRIEALIELLYRDVVARGARYGRPLPAEPGEPGGSPAPETPRRFGRRLRRSGPVRRAEALGVRLLDRVLAPSPGTGFRGALRRGFARLLRRGLRQS